MRQEEQAALHSVPSLLHKNSHTLPPQDLNHSLALLKQAQILKDEASVYFKEKNYSSALKKYYEALDRISHLHMNQDKSEGYNHLLDILYTNIAQSLYFSDKYSEVIEHCRRINKENYNSKIKFWHALSLYETQQYEKSIAVLKEAIKAEPSNNIFLEKLKEIRLKYQEFLSEQKNSQVQVETQTSKSYMFKWALVGLAVVGIGVGVYYMRKRKSG